MRTTIKITLSIPVLSMCLILLVDSDICDVDHYTRYIGNVTECIPCEPSQCSPGLELFPQCGTIITNTTQVYCQKCPDGTYSDTISIENCKPCRVCGGENRDSVEECKNISNSRCGNCSVGFYELEGFCHKEVEKETMNDRPEETKAGENDDENDWLKGLIGLSIGVGICVIAAALVYGLKWRAQRQKRSKQADVIYRKISEQVAAYLKEKTIQDLFSKYSFKETIATMLSERGKKNWQHFTDLCPLDENEKRILKNLFDAGDSKAVGLELLDNMISKKGDEKIEDFCKKMKTIRPDIVKKIEDNIKQTVHVEGETVVDLSSAVQNGSGDSDQCPEPDKSTVQGTSKKADDEKDPSSKKPIPG